MGCHDGSFFGCHFHVYLVRKPEIKINDATTWSSSHLLGLTPDLDQIRARVRDQVDFFINAYLSINPK